MSRSIIKKKKIPFLYKIFSLILGIVTLFFIGSIINLNILSVPLLILVIFFILGFSGLSILFMLKSRIKKVGFGVGVILVIIFSISSFFINKTMGLLDNMNLGYKTYNYSVIVKNDSNYRKLKDISGSKLGYYDDGSVEVEKALNKVLKKQKLESISYEDTHSMAVSLLNGEVDSILLENSYLAIIDENMGFNNSIRKIYSFVISTNTNDIARDINVVSESFNIYVSGIDTYGEISSVSRSDVNMIISVNPDTHKILLTSIPRDYYVTLPGKSGYKDKLTHAGLYGTDMSIQTLENLLDIEINYYVKVNFSSVIDIVNAIGGISVNSDYKFTSIDNYSFSKGINNLNGEEALSFARERKAFIDGDRQRVRNQQAVFKAIFDKCTSRDIIVKYNKLLDSLMGSFVTNMPKSRITALIRMQMAKNYSWSVSTNSLEGNDSSDYTYSAPKYKAYVMIPDDDSVRDASNLIESIIEGREIDNEEVIEVGKISQGVDSATSGNFMAKLVKSSITLEIGDDYIYHGYNATYNGQDVSGSADLIEEFVVGDKTFDDYRDLVRYVTYNLGSGNHLITYNITYMDESLVLEQEVIING